VIYLGNNGDDYGANDCGNGKTSYDITLGPEPVKVGFSRGTLASNYDYATVTGHFSWLVTF